MHFLAESKNNFPTSAGLASSSSAFAALAYACTAAAGATLERAELSALARVGSASAARAVFGGFTLLPAGESSARQLFDEHYWPELRILVSLVTRESKDTSSRDAMEASRRTSPFYPAWVKDAASLLPDALDALEKRDIERLGEAARRSYLRMFATMRSADPPILYWLPESLSIIHECERMRKAGIGVWETMDAGPQVKLIWLAVEVADVRKGLLQALPGLAIIESWAGPAPVCAEAEETPWHALPRRGTFSCSGSTRCSKRAASASRSLWSEGWRLLFAAPRPSPSPERREGNATCGRPDHPARSSTT
jgi:diphosphomevalonate decarboxylase